MRFMLLGRFAVYEFAIAIGAFDPAVLFRELQPDARMTKATFATITGHTPLVYDLCFWRSNRHGFALRSGAR